MGGDRLAFMKGAPEKVASFCQPETGKWTDLYYSWLIYIFSPNMSPEHLTYESNSLLIIANRMTHLHAKLNTKIKIIFLTSCIFHLGEWHYHFPSPPIWGSSQICPSPSVLLSWQLLTHSSIIPSAQVLIFPPLDHFNSWWIDPCSQSLLSWFILYTLTRLGFPSPNITMLSLSTFLLLVASHRLQE